MNDISGKGEESRCDMLPKIEKIKVYRLKRNGLKRKVGRLKRNGGSMLIIPCSTKLFFFVKNMFFFHKILLHL